MAPTCRRSCRQGRAPGQSSAPTATAGGRGWAGRSPCWRGARAQVLAVPQPRAGVRLSRPVPPVMWPLPPASLGFLPEEMREEVPRSRRQGCDGEGEAGHAAPWAPGCHPSSRNGVSMAAQGWAPAVTSHPPSPRSPVPSSKAVLANVPPIHKASAASPCPDPCDLPHGAAKP